MTMLGWVVVEEGRLDSWRVVKVGGASSMEVRRLK